MPSPKPKPRVAVRPSIRPHATPRAALRTVAVLDQSDSAFRGTVAEFEAMPLFQRLQSQGLIRKGPLRGWIPADLYRDYLDSEMLPLVRGLGLADRGGWIADLARAHASELERRAAAYGIPPEAAQRLARYAQHLMAPDGPPPGGSRDPAPTDRAPAGPSLQGAEGPQAFLVDFAQRFGVGMEGFRRCVLSDDLPIAEASRLLGAPEPAVRAAREAALCILLLDLAAGPTAPPAPVPGAEPHEVVASIVPGPAGLPALAMEATNEYALTYYMDPRAIDTLYRLASSPAEADELLRRMRDLNRRKTVLYRILAALMRKQSAYLLSGDEADLAPLTQAELARAIGEHPSTVCRMLRGRWVEVAGRPCPITCLLPSRTRVIAGLIARRPESADRAIADEMCARFGLELSRRTIAYHRARWSERGRETR